MPIAFHDWLDKELGTPHMDKLRDLAIFSIDKAINAEIISTTVPSASTPDHAIAYDSGSTLALADMLEAKELLDDQNVPMSDRHMVVDSAQLNDLFNISGFTSSDFLTSGAPLQSGEVSSPLLGFMPHFSTSASAVTYMFHRSYLTLAAQQGMGRVRPAARIGQHQPLPRNGRGHDRGAD